MISKLDGAVDLICRFANAEITQRLDGGDGPSMDDATLDAATRYGWLLLCRICMEHGIDLNHDDYVRFSDFIHHIHETLPQDRMAIVDGSHV